MNNLLIREIPLKLIIRLFDAYLSDLDNFLDLHVYVCASFLKNWSEKLKILDYSELFIFIQHLPTNTWSVDEIELLLSQAYMLKVYFSKNQNINENNE
jgi:hypothetical protein